MAESGGVVGGAILPISELGAKVRLHSGITGLMLDAGEYVGEE